MIRSQIQTCDTSKPYIFISYSRKDWGTVWPDVLEFQRHGYNIWIDTENMSLTEESWFRSAEGAIKNRRCALLIFYVSSNSLCSEPCLRELRVTKSRHAEILHGGRFVPSVAVEVEEIGDLETFSKAVNNKELQEDASDEQIIQRVETMTAILEEFFQVKEFKNDRLRIQPKTCQGPESYYQNFWGLFDKYLSSAPASAASAPVPTASAPVPMVSAPADSAPVPPEPAAPPVPTAEALHTTKTLGTTDMKYNICTFGAAFHIGAGVPVTLAIGGKRYERKTHNTVKGRIDGMKQLYVSHGLKLGDVLDAQYSPTENTIYLTKLSAAQ